MGMRTEKGTQVGVCFEERAVSLAAVDYDNSGRPRLRFSARLTISQEAERQEILKELVREYRLEKAEAVAVLSVNSYQLLQVAMAEVPAEERREAARWMIRDRIDYPPEEAVIDLFEVAPYGSEKQPLTYVVSAPEKILRERVGLLRNSRLKLKAIDIPEFALRNLCDLFPDDTRGVAVLLLLENTGLLVIAREGTLYMVRLFTLGMTDLLPFAAGDYETLTDQLDAIVLEVQRSFDYCESTFHLPLVSRLLVAQTEQEIPAVISYLNEYLALPVESFSLAERLLLPADTEQLALNRNLLAIGAALRQGRL